MRRGIRIYRVKYRTCPFFVVRGETHLGDFPSIEVGAHDVSKG